MSKYSFAPSGFLALIIRGIQLVFSIIGLGVSAGTVHQFGSWDRGNFAVAASVISFVYLLVTIFAFPFISPLVSLVAESILMIFWLAAFAAVADVFGSASCSYTTYSYTFHSTGCRLSKTFIAFGVLNWVMFLVSLGLLIWFTIVPVARAGGFSSLNQIRSLSRGALFTSFIPATGSKDLEAGNGISGYQANGVDSVPEDKAETVDPEPTVEGTGEGAVESPTVPPTEPHSTIH
ncbi:hypothetical protein JA9_004832 [Meyerozyma sp. JA9]|jgi:hypothetical protein|nr:hypothetical protein JA9_004832 [Meyerozyma sp. JA9]